MNTRQLLWRILAFRPWHALGSTVSWILISLVPVGLGLVAKAFFDTLSGGAPAMAGLWWLVVLPVVVQGGRLLVTWISVPIQVVHRAAMSALLSRNMLAHILSRPGAAALPIAHGDVISRFRDDVDEVSTFLSIMRLLSLAGESVTILVVLALMLRTDAFVTVVAILPLLAIVLVARAAGNRVNRYREASRAATGRVTGALGEIFGMVQAIKLAGAERLVTEHLRGLGDQRRQETVKDSLFNEMLRSVFINTASLGTGLVLLTAAGAMRDGIFTVGDFAMFAAYVGRVTLYTGSVGEILARYRQVKVSLGRMQALMANAPAEALVAHGPVHLDGPLPQISRPAIRAEERLVSLEAKELTYLHPSSGRGVLGASLNVRRGSLTVITGRVGSGKTTLVRALLGLLPTQAGEVRWNGRLVADPAAHFQPPFSSYTPQVPVLFSASLKENILLGLPEEQAGLSDAIGAAVLEQDVAGLEQGLETAVGARGVKLSGGQAQRSAAARMFVRDPELLVFDDLSSALDVETERLLWDRLRRRPLSTCLAVSHRRTALQAADHIVVLKEGRVDAEGTWAELLASSAEFQAIWRGAIQPQ